MRLAACLLAAAGVLAQTPPITWTQKQVQTGAGKPGGVGFTIPIYDPVSGQTFHWLKNYGSASIYSTNVFFYNPDGSGTWADVGGTDSVTDACPADTPTMPGDRHPNSQMAHDSSRNRIWIFGGAASVCTPTPYGPNGTPRGDMYYMTLNANPLSNTWTQVDISDTIPTVPREEVSANGSAMIYDPDSDLLFMYGRGDSFVYCLGSTLTQAHQNAGCTQLNRWTDITSITTGGPPAAAHMVGMVYSTVKHRAYLFGGHTSDVHKNETWEYNVGTRTWTQKCSGGCSPPPVGNPPVGQVFVPSMAYNTLTGKIHLRQYGGTGAPGDWVYDPDADTWTELSTTGGPTNATAMAFDPVRNQLIAYENPDGVAVQMWVGQIEEVSIQARILGSWASGNVKWAEVCGVVPSLTTGSTASLTLTGPNGLSVPLTIQEGVHSGITGVSRTNEPFCQGVPIADSAGVTSVSSLGLNGASVPNANMGTDGSTITVNTGAATFTIKKANTNIVDSVVIGGTTVVASSTSATRGLVLMGPDPNASFPSNVTCNPDSATAPTGSGSDCTTVYSSANDANSTAVLEKNGPISAVVKLTGTHKDASGNPYMHFTVRLYFWYNRPWFRAQVVLRNASYSTAATPSSDCNNQGGSCAGQTFNTAYKGLRSYELRIGANITGTLNYTIATHGADQTGTLDQGGGTDTAFIYQGGSSWMVPLQDSFVCAAGSECGNTYTTDSGYVVKKNTTTLASGTATQYPTGWADVRSSGGIGVLAAVQDFAAQWPVSIEFASGGADVRCGIYSAQNTKNIYMPWPHWRMKECYFWFHTSALATPSEQFRQMHYPLMARASVDYYNSTGVFPYPIPSIAQEKTFQASLVTGADPAVNTSRFCYGGSVGDCLPTPDRSATDSFAINNAMGVAVYRAYSPNLGGPLNQTEFRWSDLMRWLQAGHTGRWTNSRNFFLWLAGTGWAHADGTTSSDKTINGFRWNSRTGTNPYELQSFNWPVIECDRDFTTVDLCTLMTNSDKSIVTLFHKDASGEQHAHVWGIYDMYFLTGEELLKESVVPLIDYYDPAFSTAWQVTAQGSATRDIGIRLVGASHYYEYLRAIGDSSNATEVLNFAKNIYTAQVRPDTCVSGYPTGCTPITVDTYPSQPDSEPAGINRKRGVHTAPSFRAGVLCGQTGIFRAQSAFQAAILNEGLLMLRRSAGSSWQYYTEALDLAYGLSQWAFSESYNDDGQSHWYTGGGTAGETLYNGFHPGTQPDHAFACPAYPGTAVGTGTGTVSGSTFTRSTGTVFDGSWDEGRYRIDSNYQRLYFWDSLAAPQGENYITAISGDTVTMLYPMTITNQPVTFILNYQRLTEIGGVPYDSDGHVALAIQTVWTYFWTRYLVQGQLTTDDERKMKNALRHVGERASNWPADFGAYHLGAAIYAIDNPGAALQTISLTGFTDHGDGTYTLQWTVPAGCQSYRVKYAPLAIVDWIGFNTAAFTFTGNPATTDNWFAATSASNTPACGTPGTTQSLTVNTGTPGWPANHFSIKAQASGFDATISIKSTGIVRASGNVRVQ